MTKEERLEKSVEFLRSFAKKVVTVCNVGGSLNDVRGVVRTYENQWPNWLDEGIEDVPEEDTEEENFFVDNVDEIIAEQQESGGQFLLNKMAKSAKVRTFNLDALTEFNKRDAVASLLDLLPKLTDEEILKRAPKFFNKDRLTRFLHAFSRLEYVFPEVDWNEVSVRELDEAASAALQALPDKEKGR